MTDDLVTRLRSESDEVAPYGKRSATMRDAADEIERLRALITEWADSEDAHFAAVQTGAPFDGPMRMCALSRKVDAYDALRQEAGR